MLSLRRLASVLEGHAQGGPYTEEYGEECEE